MKKFALILTSSLASFSQLQAADGKAVYNSCLACHQANGQGIPNVFPPLAESDWVNGPVENLIRIQLRGLTGPIEVNGSTYNGAMPPVAQLSDEEIAAVLTYIRSNFGNKSSAVTADQVKALRSEVGQPMLKASDLIDPTKKAEKAAEGSETKSSENAEVKPPATTKEKPAE